MEKRLYGDLNEHSVGILMKAAVERAIDVIRGRRFKFETEEKKSYKASEDFVTDADKAAQEMYIRLLRENFPTFGIVAEEDELMVQLAGRSQSDTTARGPGRGGWSLHPRRSQAIGCSTAAPPVRCPSFLPPRPRLQRC